jgi:hypothetical protein
MRETVSIEQLCEDGDAECLTELKDFEPEFDLDLDKKIPSEGTDSFYA